MNGPQANKYPLHAALDRLGADPATGLVRGELGATQKREAGSLARQMGVSEDTVVRLVTGRLAGSPAPMAELKKVAHDLESAFHKPSTQADAGKRERVASLHTHSLRAQKQALGARTTAVAQAQQHHQTQRRAAALAIADKHLDAAARQLSALATLSRGAGRDGAAEGAKRSILQAQASLRAARPGAGQPPDAGHDQVQARAKMMYAELKSLA